MTTIDIADGCQPRNAGQRIEYITQENYAPDHRVILTHIATGNSAQGNSHMTSSLDPCAQSMKNLST